LFFLRSFFFLCPSRRLTIPVFDPRANDPDLEVKKTRVGLELSFFFFPFSFFLFIFPCRLSDPSPRATVCPPPTTIHLRATPPKGRAYVGRESASPLSSSPLFFLFFCAPFGVQATSIPLRPPEGLDRIKRSREGPARFLFFHLRDGCGFS